MKFEQFREMDQYSERTRDWLYNTMKEYGLNHCQMVEIHRRDLCIPDAGPISTKVPEHYVSNDIITEIIVDKKLFAMMYERRDDFNYTEINTFILGTKKDIKELKNRWKNDSRE